jgi:hypothetical protein
MHGYIFADDVYVSDSADFFVEGSARPARERTALLTARRGSENYTSRDEAGAYVQTWLL